MENQNSNRLSDPELTNKVEKDRRKSDFLSRYEELTCKAALAIKSVDQIVKCDRKFEYKNENNRNELNIQSLDSPITPEVESVEFNEEEVLKTCQDFLEDYDRTKTSQFRSIPNYDQSKYSKTPPTPAPRLSLTNRNDFSSKQITSQLSHEDEQLLKAAQGKSFWENQGESVFEKIDNVNPEVFDSKIIRTRSSSLTIHDKKLSENEEKIKPILKKSTEDLAESNRFPSILKTRDDFGVYNQKSKIEGKSEHVRIQSPSFDRNDHVRIRSPSPDFDNETADDDQLLNDRSSSPEIPSILKSRFRRASVDNISIDELQNDDEPQSILKRKASFGSGSHSPEGSSENTKSILKKSSRSSSRTCSRSGSTEELDLESTKSILKSRNSSRTCSRSGSQEELDLDFDDEWESRPKSILKKKPGSTDDELDERDRPKSILKSRRSEESLSPNSDLIDTPSHSILRDGRSSSGTRQSSVISDNEEILVISGRNSPSLRISGRNSPLFPDEHIPRPILKNRDDVPHSILKRREKSTSPSGRLSPSTSDINSETQNDLKFRNRDHAGFDPDGNKSSWAVNRSAVTNRANLFMELNQADPRPPKPSESPLFLRKQRNHVRHMTQPVTPEEVSEAASLSIDNQGGSAVAALRRPYRLSDDSSQPSIQHHNAHHSAVTPPTPHPRAILGNRWTEEGPTLLSNRWSEDSPLLPSPQPRRFEEQLNSPASPVRASPARVIPAETSQASPEDSPRSFYFRPVSRSPTRNSNRPSSWRSNSSPPPQRSSSPPPPQRQSPPLRRKFSNPNPVFGSSGPRRSFSSPPPSSPIQTPSPPVLESEPRGPIPISSPTLKRYSSRSPSFDGILRSSRSSSIEDIHGILKNCEGSVYEQAQGVPLSSEQKTPTKSILKLDSVEDPTPTKGVLKKDPSYEAPSGRHLPSSSSSNEDLARNFSDVIIDPVPGQGRRSAPETPVKKSNGTRTPVIHPHRVCISADGNLASKLAQLAGEADCIKQKMSDVRQTARKTSVFQKSSSVDSETAKSASEPGKPAGDRSVSPAAVLPDQTPQPKPRVNPELPPQPQNSRVSKSPSVQRKSSRASDLPAASDFYAIYQQQKRRSASPTNPGTGNLTPNLSSPSSGLSPSSSFSPASNSPGEGAFQRYNGERRSLRQRSASPQCRRSVEFWENKGEDQKRGRSQERAEQGNMPEKSEIKVGGGGIMERLAALQKHGEEEWRKRIKNKTDSPELIIGKVPRSGVISSSSGDEEVVTLRAPKNNVRPVSLVDRLSKLNSAQNEWQKKVGEKDTEKFTVAGKMEREKIIKNVVNSDVKKEQKLPTVIEKVVSTPVSKVHEGDQESSCTKRTPKMVKFKGTSGGSDTTPKPNRPVSCFVESSPSVNLLSPFVRSGSIRRVSTPETNAPKLDPISSKTVSIPQQDSQMLDSFFAKDSSSSPKISLNTSDFDMLSTEPLLITKKAIIKPKRTKGSRNPLKSLAARTDIPESYTEVLYGVADREFKRKNIEKASKHSHLAVEALAGLASTEDFTSVHLRKGVALPHQNMLPYKEKMLIQVKGRRFCQSRVVAPVSESLNSGDCFILVTSSEVYNWQGKFSNVIERARSAEVALSILQKKDLGCKGAAKVDTIEEEKIASCSRENRKFWKCLTGKDETGKVAEAGHADEDEEYEQQIVEASCVYEVDIESDELIPVEEGWGAPPKHEILKNSKVLVFDFGSEVYVYNGKNAPFETRKAGARLAQDLWGSGWDYSDCNINPVYGQNRDMICDTRPAWTVLGRINSCMETIIFREKFLDWPDKTRVIGKRTGDKEKDDIIDVNVAPQWAWADLKGINGEELASRELSEPNLELEGSHLGRGRGYYDEEERRQYEITTLKVTAWHVEESNSKPLAEFWTGQFHSGDTYVVRWNYKVALTGRALKGGASKFSAVGRERCAYFFWQGEESRISLQGASALHTVELDSERGPQLRVREGREHAAFLSLWSGKMVIYKGRREDVCTQKWRMFIVRGEDENETFLKEVDCDISSLRSRGVLLIVNNRKVIVWSGKQATKHQVNFGLSKANQWKLETPSEFSNNRLTSMETLEAGRETSEFWEAISGSSLKYKNSTRDDIDLKSTPRLFNMTSVLGTFEVTEIKPDFRKMGVINSLLFSQAILYEAEQPALFMFDCGSQLYLWQGWIPSDSEAEDPESPSSVTTGSGKVRWHAERRAAMQTMLEYRKAKYGNPVPSAKLVWAGHESKEFINYFPQWIVNQDIAKINKEFVASEDLQSTYNELSRSEYSWKELQIRPLPHGVDPARIETYLSNALFQEKFKMTKEEYEACPRWKQIDMKKEIGLF